MCSETTTSSTELPEMSPEEQSLMAQAAALVPIYMEQAGFDMSPRTTVKYDNPELVESLRSDITRLQDEQRQLTDKPDKQPFDYQRLNQINAELQSANNRFQDESSKSKTVTEWDVELNEAGRKMQAQREKALDYQSQVQDMTMDNVRKFLSGDFGITDDQRKQIQQSMSSIREPVNQMFDEVTSEAERTGRSMNEALGGYLKQIDQTGLSVGAALNAVGERISDTRSGILSGVGEEENRIRQTGREFSAALSGVRNEINTTGGVARDALERSFAIRTTLARRQMEDLYENERKANAQKASLLGRSPMDPQFQMELQQKMMRQIGTMELEMAEQEALQRVGLLERTGLRREQLGLEEAAGAERGGLRFEAAGQRRTAAEEATGLRREALAGEEAGLAERLGGRREESERLRMGIAERTGGMREQVAGQRAGLEESLARQGEGLRWEVGMGIPARQAGLGMDVSSFLQARQQQGLANVAAAQQVPMAQAAPMAQERFAQPTITQTQQGSALGGILGAAGTAAGIYGNLMQGGLAGSIREQLTQQAPGQVAPRASLGNFAGRFRL